MKSINLTFDLFRDFAFIQEDEIILLAALDLLVMRNEQWLHRRPDTPLLYESGVYYQEEPDGEEEFASIPRVLRLGSGDCDDLTAYRVAELRVRFGDVNARPYLIGNQTAPDYIQYHVMVMRGDGMIEDPSLILGMGDTAEAVREDMLDDGSSDTRDVPETYPELSLWRDAA